MYVAAADLDSYVDSTKIINVMGRSFPVLISWNALMSKRRVM